MSTRLKEHEGCLQARLVAGALLALLVAACGPSEISDGERRAALKGTTERVVLPTYAELGESARELSAQLAELSTASSAQDLARLRDSYHAVRSPFEESEAFAFGPAVELRSLSLLDEFPIDTAKLEAELSGAAELTAGYVVSLPATVRGLHGIEYLLFPEDDVQVEALLLEDSDAGARRRQYVRSLGQIVADSAQALSDTWAPQGGGYGRRFSEPGKPDSVSDSVQGGLDTLVTESVFLSELVADSKLGKPLDRAKGVAAPSVEESALAGTSLSDVLGNLRGMRSVYLGSRDGSDQVSLSSLVRTKSPSADEHARAAFDAARAAVEAIPEPLSEAVSARPETVNAGFDAVKTLRRVLATEVLGALGSSLMLGADGD